MSAAITAAVVGAGIITGGNLISSNANAKAANKATDAQLSAQQQQQANFNLVQGQEAPYRQLGEQNIPELQKMLSGGYDMKASPSAQYAMTQGTRSINSALGARGLEGTAVQQLGQLSSQTAANDYQNRFNQLLSATNIGSNAVAMTGSGVNNLNNNLQAGAGNLGNINMANGNQQATGIGAAAGGLASITSGLLGNYQNSSRGSTGSTGSSPDSSFGVLQSDQGYSGWNPSLT
jgi:hypothetical protein